MTWKPYAAAVLLGSVAGFTLALTGCTHMKAECRTAYHRLIGNDI